VVHAAYILSRSLISGTRLMLGYTQEMLVTANEARIEARDAGTTTTRRRQLTSEFLLLPRSPVAGRSELGRAWLLKKRAQIAVRT